MEKENEEVAVAENTGQPNNAKINKPTRPNTRSSNSSSSNAPRRSRPNAPTDDFEPRIVAINRISKTVKGGRKMRFNALVISGNKKGVVGFGTGKANEVPDAIKKATTKARKETIKVPIVKGGTIPHMIIGKYGASQVFLRPAPEGTGVIAGGAVRAIVELAGIKNVYSKIYGSRTSINAVRATINALSDLKTRQKVAILRGVNAKDL